MFTLGTFVNSFSSARDMAKFFNCDRKTIKNHINSEKLFRVKWELTTFLIDAQ